jgi:hypothetical protein
MESKGSGIGDLEFGGSGKGQEVSTLEYIPHSDNGAAREMDPTSLNAGLQRGLKDRRKWYALTDLSMDQS